MPSFLDMLQSSSGEPDGDAPLDVLASVKTEGGRRRRRRHRRNMALSGLALALVAVPAFAFVGGSDDRQDVESTDLAGSDDDRDRDEAPEQGAVATATTATTAPGTEVAGVVITQVPEEPVVTAPPATTPPPTAPPLVCENSTDPACGDFFWSPAPGGNGALTLTAPQGLTVPAGQSIDVVISWSDPDATLEWQYVDPFGTLIGAGCSHTQRFGPWAPPSPSGGSGTFTYRYTAPVEAAETVQTLGVSAAASTLAGDCDDPYRSEANLLVDVIVTEPAS